MERIATGLSGDAQKRWGSTYERAMRALPDGEMSQQMAEAVAWRAVREGFEIGADGSVTPKEEDASPEGPAGLVQLTGPLVWQGAEDFRLEDGAYAPVQAARTGTWIGGWGQEIVLTEEVFDDLVANWESGIRGQDVPFLFDHFPGGAPGWVSGLWRQGEYLMAQPAWTDLGVDAIGKGHYRYLSIGLDLENRVLWEISLTNMPAIKGLAPLQLSQADASEAPQRFYFLGQRLAELLVPPPDEPEPTSEPEREGGEVNEPHSDSEGDSEMAEFDLARYPLPEEGLTDEQKAQLAEHFGIQLQPPEAEREPAPVEPEGADMQTRMAEAIKAGSKGLQELIAELREENQRQLAEEIKMLREDQALTEFSEAMCNEGRQVLPGTASEMKALLSAVSQPARGKLMEYLKSVKAAGLVDLTERGTEDEGVAAKKKPLPGEAKLALRQHLSQGGSLEMFFKANEPDLGKASQYDLSEWE